VTLAQSLLKPIGRGRSRTPSRWEPPSSRCGGSTSPAFAIGRSRRRRAADVRGAPVRAGAAARERPLAVPFPFGPAPALARAHRPRL